MENSIVIDNSISKVLEWPSYTISIRQSFQYDDNNFEFLTGTNTANQEANYITLLNASLTEKSHEIVIKRKYKHFGNVLKVLSYNDSFLISASSNNNLYLYNLNQDCNEISTKPDLILKSYTTPCTSLSIGNNKQLLLSSSEKGEVSLWDLKYDINTGVIEPLSTTTYHKGKVNDVDWNYSNENLFSSCGEDKMIFFYDVRDHNKKMSVMTGSSVKKISFNKANPNLFLSASGKNIIDLWDLRNTKIKLHTFQFHSHSITGLKWSDRNENLFVSTGNDGNLVMWNVKHLGNTKSSVLSEDTPVEAELIHRKKGKIYDFDWKGNAMTLVDNQNNIEVIKTKVNIIGK